MQNAANQRPDGRVAGVILFSTSIAALILLALHPASQAGDFATVLRDEAANQLRNGLVHGGYVAMLPFQIIGYAILAGRLRAAPLASIAAMVFLTAGDILLGASVTIDGLIVPAIAARYAQAADKIETARALFVLCGSAIRVLMPAGLAFEAVAVASWGAALFPAQRIAGIVGLALGLGLLTALGANLAALNSLVEIGGLLAVILWNLVPAWLLLARSV